MHECRTKPGMMRHGFAFAETVPMLTVFTPAIWKAGKSSQLRPSGNPASTSARPVEESSTPKHSKWWVSASTRIPRSKAELAVNIFKFRILAVQYYAEGVQRIIG